MGNRNKYSFTMMMFLVFLLFSFALQAEANPNGPKHSREIVTKLPHGYKALKGGLFFHNGAYYRRGQNKFFIVTPPVGLMVNHLPIGYVSLNVGGVPYYHYQEVYYRPISNGYVVVERPLDAPPLANAEIIIIGNKVAVTAEWLNLRSGPDTKHPVQRTLRKGTEVTIKEVASEWYFVELRDGTSGWVLSRFTRRLKVPAQG